MKRILNNFDKYLKFYFLISIVVLSAAVFFLYRRVDLISKALEEKLSGVVLRGSGVREAVSREEGCGKECEEKISQSVELAVSTIAATIKTPTAPTATQKTSIPSQTRNQTVYIPLGSTFSTKSVDWVDAPGSEVYIDLVNEYGERATASWDASLKVAHGNGKAFARLFDATHATAVDASELSLTTPDYSQVFSGNLPLWRGRNLYKVQIKSLNSFEVSYGSGRIKISY